MKQEDVKNEKLEQNLNDDDLEGAAGGKVGQVDESQRIDGPIKQNL